MRLLCPSMMCADVSNLSVEVKELDKANVDIYHLDIMDGKFVRNFALGLQDVIATRRLTNKLIDVHLMIDNPGDYVELFATSGADIIYFHPEADIHPTETINKIITMDKKVGIAINPGTSLPMIQELLPLADYVMIMTVNPGFAGQKYLQYVNDKIIKLIDYKIEHNLNFITVVDGAISTEKIVELSQLGVDGFVLGTSSLFKKNKTYQEIIENIRNL